ncbi:MAG: hypothetical protein HOP33_00130 [Verrucomicrobia bacterium]|nr:hypothetical protein [Verrucomicrobiota bacterium]
MSNSRSTPLLWNYLTGPARWLLLCSLVSLLGYGDVPAQGVLFTDRTTFNAALRPVPSPTTITFSGLTDPFGTGTSPVSVSGVTFTNAESRLFVQPTPIPGDGQYLWNFDSSYPVGIFLPNGRNAFGADFSGGIEPNASFNATLTVNLVGGQTYSYNFSGQRGLWTFFGVAFPQSITSLIYHDGGQFLPGSHEEMLDNVTFGVATVPEPHATVMIACALAILLRARSRSGLTAL